MMGAFPLGLISGFYVWWYFNKPEWIHYAGIGCAVVALFCLISGLRHLHRHREKQKELKELPQGAERREPETGPVVVFLAYLMLLSGLPALGWATWDIADTLIRYEIQIINSSGQTISNVTLSSPGFELPVGDLKPNQVMVKRLRFPEEGALEFSASFGGRKIGGPIDKKIRPWLMRRMLLKFFPRGNFICERWVPDESEEDI